MADIYIVGMGTMMLDMDIKYNLHMSPISVSHIQLADLSRPFGLIHIVSSQDEDWHSQCSPEAFSGYWLPRSLRLGRLNGAAKRTELQSVKLSNFPSIAKKNLRKKLYAGHLNCRGVNCSWS